MIKKIGIIVLFLIISQQYAYAQFVDFGQDPPGIRWEYIGTKNFDLIYPDFYKYNAGKIAILFDSLYIHANSLNHRPGKMTMVIHACGGISNGSVAWAPKRTDLHTAPSQSPGDLWLYHLCTHEYRHMVQIDKVKTGTTRLLHILFGQQAVMGVIGICIPMWYMEGDAVNFETSTGKFGRGRSPEFLNRMKAQIMEKGIYTYDKAALGSYRHFVPDRYVFGYYMVGRNSLKYGNALWNDMLTNTGRLPLGGYPFRRTIKKHLDEKRESARKMHKKTYSGISERKNGNAVKLLYYDTFSELRKQWGKDSVKNRFDTILTSNRHYAEYFYPRPYEDGKILAYKKGMDEGGAFVLLSGGKEKILTKTGITDDKKFALKGKRILWTEYHPHIFYELGGKNGISSYDIDTKKYLIHRSANNRYSPFAVENGWGFVETDKSGHSYIVITDEKLEKEYRRFPADKNEHFIHPSCSGKEILVVVQSPKGLRIEAIDISDGRRTPVTDYTDYEIDNPVRSGRDILFRSAANTNNTFYRLENGNIRNITNSKFGMRFPQPAKDTLYFSFYTSDGYKPGKIAMNKLQNNPVEYKKFELAEKISSMEKWSSGTETVFDNSASGYTSGEYSRPAHAVNIHSWSPVFLNTNELSADMGITVYSQNVLSSLIVSGGYIFNKDYSNGAWKIAGSYRGIRPILNFEFRSGDRKLHNSTGIVRTQYEKDIDIKTKHRFADISALLPLNLSRKNRNIPLSFYARYKHEVFVKQKIRFPGYMETGETRFPDLRFNIGEAGLRFSDLHYHSNLDIAPRWGLSVNPGYARTVGKSNRKGEQYWLNIALYFPGIFRHHSFQTYTGYQHSDTPLIHANKKIRNPRGLSTYGEDRFSITSSYKFPIAYPEYALGSVVYIKRIRGGAFFDYGIQYRRKQKSNFQSYGFELLGDTHLLRLPLPMHIGFRTGYETQSRSFFGNFLMDITLSL